MDCCSLTAQHQVGVVYIGNVIGMEESIKKEGPRMYMMPAAMGRSHKFGYLPEPQQFTAEYTFMEVKVSGEAFSTNRQMWFHIDPVVEVLSI